MVDKSRCITPVILILLVSLLLSPMGIGRISSAIDVDDGTLSDWVNVTVSFSDTLGDSPIDMTDLVFVSFDFDDTWLYVRWDIDNDGTKKQVLYDMGINLTAAGMVWDIFVAAQIETIGGIPTLINISIRDDTDACIWTAEDNGNITEDGSIYLDPPPGGTPGTISVEARFPLSYIASTTGLIFSQFRSHASTTVGSNVKDFVPDSGYIILSVDDGFPELANLTDTPDPQVSGGNVNITVDAKDDFKVESVWVNITYPDSSWTNLSMLPGLGDEWFFNTSFIDFGLYSYTVWANDSSDNWNSTGPGMFIISGDAIPPEFGIAGDFPDPQSPGGFVNVSVDVTDNVGVGLVWINITLPNGTWINTTMTQGAGDNWYYNSTYSDLGAHSYTIWANDTSDNWNSTSPETFTIQDTDAPQFSNLNDTPDPQENGGFVNISSDVTDNVAVDEVWVNITYPNGSWVNVSMTPGAGDNRFYNGTYPDIGGYSYIVWANDTSSNWNSTGSETFTIEDSDGPQFSNLDDIPDPQENGGFVNISLDVIDDIGVDEVWVNITYPDSSWVNVSMVPGSGNGWYYNNTYADLGLFSYVIWANDTSNNWNITGPGTFTIQDTDGPVFSNLDDTPDPQENGGAVNITVDLIDDVGVDGAWVNITYPNSSWVNVSMAPGSGNSWYYISIFPDLGVHSYVVWANDTSNNWNGTGPGTFSIQDTDGPEFSNLDDIPDPAQLNGYVNITVDVIDDVGVDSVWVNITYPDSSWNNVSMVQGTGDGWYYNTSHADLGVYSYVVWANDTSNNWNGTGPGDFMIQDTQGPEILGLFDFPDPQDIGGYVNITVNVTDSVGVGEVWVNITYPNGSWLNISMEPDSGNGWFYNDTFNDLGTYSYTVWANDTSNNWNSSVPGGFEIKGDIISPALWNLTDFPDPQTPGGFVNITLDVTDDTAVGEVWLNITNPGGLWVNVSMAQGQLDEWYYNSTYIDSGVFSYVVWANDTSNNWNTTGPGTFSIVDNEAPELLNLDDTPDPQENGGFVNISVDVTDDVGVDTVWVNITSPDGSWNNVSMTKGAFDNWFFNTNYPALGGYSYAVWANDTSGNWNGTGPGGFTIQDTDGPVLSNLDDLPDPQENGGFVNISVDVIDDIGVDEVRVNITYSNGTWVNASMNKGAGDGWFFNTSYPDLGLHSYTVWANDTSNNWNSTGPATFLVQDTDGPQFSNLNDMPDPQENGGVVNITVDVVDDIGVDEVWINITYPDSSWMNMSMAKGIGDEWFFNNSYLDLGVHSYTIWANDTSDNWNSTTPATFLIQDTDGPQFSNLDDFPDPQEINGTVNITVDVIDDIAVSGVWVNITYQNGSWVNLSMLKGPGNGWFYNTTYPDLGVFIYRIWANDSSGNWNSSGPGSFEIKIDIVPPIQWNLNDFPDPQVVGGFVNLTVFASDDVAVSLVWVNVTSPSGTWINYTMIQGIGFLWFFNTTYFEPGVYSYTVCANDTSDNLDFIGPGTFTILDVIPPEIDNSLDMPDPQENGGYVNITVDVIDDVAVGSVWIKITYPNGSWVNITMESGAGNGWYYNANYSDVGVYTYQIWATDTSNNWNFTGPGTLMIIDTDGPEIRNIFDTPDPQENGGPVNITCEIIDDIGTDEVWIVITYPDGSWTNISMFSGTGNEWYYNAPYPDLGIHSYIIWAKDLSDNWNYSVQETFLILDTDGPEFSGLIDTPDPQMPGGFVNISVNVYDDCAVDEVWIYITYPDTTWINVSMIQGLGNGWYYNTTYPAMGIHSYIIWAKDISDNWNSTGPGTFEIFYSDAPPELSNLNDFPDPASVGDFVTITVNVIDDFGVDEVWLNIMYPGNTLLNVSMYPGSNNVWFYTGDYFALDVYIYRVLAKDSGNQWSGIGPQTFTILDTKPPNIDNINDIPDPQENGEFVNISVDVTDDVAVNEVWINIRHPDGNWMNRSMGKGVGDEWYIHESYSEIGLYIYVIWATDTNGNWNRSVSESFVIRDTDAPEIIESEEMPEQYNENDEIELIVEVVDDVEISGVWINITFPDGVWINATMEQGPNDQWYFNGTFDVLGNYTYTIWTVDSSGNWNTTEPEKFLVLPEEIPGKPPRLLYMILLLMFWPLLLILFVILLVRRYESQRRFHADIMQIVSASNKYDSVHSNARFLSFIGIQDLVFISQRICIPVEEIINARLTCENVTHVVDGNYGVLNEDLKNIIDFVGR